MISGELSNLDVDYVVMIRSMHPLFPLLIIYIQIVQVFAVLENLFIFYVHVCFAKVLENSNDCIFCVFKVPARNIHLWASLISDLCGINLTFLKCLFFQSFIYLLIE